MGITRRATEPQGVTNTNGQPEIVLEIEGLTLSMAPPARADNAGTDDSDDSEAADVED